MAGNFILPFQLESSALRGRIVRLESLIQDILGPHDYPAPVSQLCADMIVLCALLSSMLKYDGLFTLQAQGDGPLKMMVCDMISGGLIRACATFDREDITDDMQASLSLFGKGYLAFTVDQGAHMERYQGIVELKGETLADSVQNYFQSSEQVRTGIVLAANTQRGQGILLQHMPEEGGQNSEKGGSNVEEDDWRRAMILMQSCTEEELLNADLSAEDILTRLFHEEGVRIYDSKPVSKDCRCSPERLLELLKTMPQDDLDHMTVDGQITMHCEFCNKDFAFQPDEISRPV